MRAIQCEMTSQPGFDLQRVLRELGDVSEWDLPQGYPGSLALCVMDAIWSLGVRYRTVENVLERYLRARGYTGLDASESCQDGPRDFLEWYRGVGGVQDPERAAEALSNWNRTSTINGVLKVEAVARASELLIKMDIHSTEGLRAKADLVGPRWRSEIPGQGSGISWRYVLMLAGEPGVKPDRMVKRFMNRMNCDPALAPEEFVTAIQTAFGEPAPSLTMIDHRIWTVERSTPDNELDSVENLISSFATARDWDQFHSIKNLLLAMVGEVGELAELVQWKSDRELEEFLSTEEGQKRFGEEVADVFIYLVRIAQKAGLDIAKVVSEKLIVNERKYPVAESRGNAVKYSER